MYCPSPLSRVSLRRLLQIKGRKIDHFFVFFVTFWGSDNDFWVIFRIFCHFLGPGTRLLGPDGDFGLTFGVPDRLWGVVRGGPGPKESGGPENLTKNDKKSRKNHAKITKKSRKITCPGVGSTVIYHKKHDFLTQKWPLFCHFFAPSVRPPYYWFYLLSWKNTQKIIKKSSKNHKKITHFFASGAEKSAMFCIFSLFRVTFLSLFWWSEKTPYITDFTGFRTKNHEKNTKNHDFFHFFDTEKTPFFWHENQPIQTRHDFRVFWKIMKFSSRKHEKHLHLLWK
jgi:hypothetical protein